MTRTLTFTVEKLKASNPNICELLDPISVRLCFVGIVSIFRNVLERLSPAFELPIIGSASGRKGFESKIRSPAHKVREPISNFNHDVLGDGRRLAKGSYTSHRTRILRREN